MLVYPDLVISVPVSERRLVVVIENKIKACEHDGQLDAYREYAAHAFDSCRPRATLRYEAPASLTTSTVTRPDACLS